MMTLWILFLALINFVISSPFNCTAIINANVSWMATFNGITMSGTALYFPNGTLVTYGLRGELINIGTYYIKDGPELCYEYETYSFPKNAADTCNSYYYSEESQSVIGCEILQDNCTAYSTCEGHWEDWYSARLVNYL
eukprot:102101_1